MAACFLTEMHLAIQKLRILLDFFERRLVWAFILRGMRAE